MPVLALTDRFVSHAKPGPEYFDDTVKGLALRVSAGGHKAWTFHFTTGGKRARVTLGSYPADRPRQGPHACHRGPWACGGRQRPAPRPEGR